MRSASLIALMCASSTCVSALSLADVSVAFSPLEARKDHNGTKDMGMGKGMGMGMGKDSINHACNKMEALTKYTEFANNQTKLDALESKGKLTADEVTKIKAKAANATAELATMSSNTTLTSQCGAVLAHERVVRECKVMAKWEKMTMAGNKTMSDGKSKKALNATQEAEWQKKMEKIEEKLKEMQSNKTLTDLCSQMKEQKGTDKGSDGSSSSSDGSKPATASKSAGTKMVAQTMPLVAGVAVLFAVLL